MPVLGKAAIEEALRALPGWKHEGGALVSDHAFADFTQAFAFVTRLALLAEKEGHHPDIDIRYNRVRVGLVSHDAGGITERDVALATKVLQLVQ
ncbi:MAG: 4a-hydroxytetrahydrobiopterin dehydratase [Acidobacteriaceae bacterium]